MLLRLQGSIVTVAGDYLVVRTPANPGFQRSNFVLAGQSGVDRPLVDLVGSSTRNIRRPVIWRSGSTGWTAGFGAMTSWGSVVSRSSAAW